VNHDVDFLCYFFDIRKAIDLMLSVKQIGLALELAHNSQKHSEVVRIWILKRDVRAICEFIKGKFLVQGANIYFPLAKRFEIVKKYLPMLMGETENKKQLQQALSLLVNEMV
jgi:hypothetical protein